jgi:hypothetical protein
MGIIISTARRNGAADSVVDAADAGAGAGKIRVYGGGSGRPAGPGTAVTDQTLLLEFTLNDPAFGAAASGVAALDVDPVLTDDGLASGTATWFRLLDSDNTAILDGSVSATGAGGDLTLTTTAIVTDLAVTITSGTITMPAGTA